MWWSKSAAPMFSDVGSGMDGAALTPSRLVAVEHHKSEANLGEL